MFKDAQTYSSFSANDLAEAKKFYGETLGVEVEDGPMGLQLKVAGGNPIFVYQKDDHQAATFTVLNFKVDDVDKAVADLSAAGVKFEHYEGMTDDKGIARGLSAKRGPDIAWFKDPAGNVLAVLQES